MQISTGFFLVLVASTSVETKNEIHQPGVAGLNVL